MFKKTTATAVSLSPSLAPGQFLRGLGLGLVFLFGSSGGFADVDGGRFVVGGA